MTNASCFPKASPGTSISDASRPAAPSPDIETALGAYRSLQRRRIVVLLTLLALLGVTFVINLALGPARLGVDDIFRALLGQGDAGAQTIIWRLRLPYAVMAVLTGLALGLAGAEMQTILDNPLASPFTLGLSAAAAFGASLAIILDWRLPFPFLSGEGAVAANAFLFAIGASLALDAVARLRGSASNTVVMFGIALVFTFQACVALLQFVASEDALQDLIFWTMGSVTRATWPKIGALLLACAIVSPFSLRSAWALTALRLGEDRAASMGVDVRRVRLASLMRISILAAIAVAFSGTIGFVGLVAPHIARRLVGEDHRAYLPTAALSGCLIMSGATIAARNLVPGQVLPVGIVTALVGIPFFLGVVLRRPAT
ncbi:iron-siderophore ABC transporter permease [Acetobacter sp. DsW_063]|nr:iron-siderophore ABC transporter permease [Acetobacter sp. DsW_063]